MNPTSLKLYADLEDGTISLYEQGEFTDLCRGPHVPHTGFVKDIKLMKVSGAYWRADPIQAQLQRIYGTAFFDKKELKDYLTFLEEAKETQPSKNRGSPWIFSAFTKKRRGCRFFIPRAWTCGIRCWITGAKNTAQAGYVETKTPIMLNRSLWERIRPLGKLSREYVYLGN